MFRSPQVSLAVSVLAALLSSALAAQAGESRTLQHDIAPGAYARIDLDVPFGDVRVQAGDSARIEVLAHCKKSRESCTRRLDRIEIRERARGDAVEIHLEDVPSSSRGFELRVTVTVPPATGLELSMHAGRVRVRDLEGDLRVRLEAGEVDVEMPHAAVRSVDLDAGVGDVTLRLPEGRRRSRRSLLVGAEAHWNDGDGAARVDVHVLAGEVKVRLD